MHSHSLTLILVITVFGSLAMLAKGKACNSWRDCDSCDDPNYARSCYAGECQCISESKPCTCNDSGNHPSSAGQTCSSWRDCDTCDDPNYARSCDASECRCIPERPCTSYKDCIPCNNPKHDRTCFSSYCHCVMPNV